jgi:hypothetical protein
MHGRVVIRREQAVESRSSQGLETEKGSSDYPANIDQIVAQYNEKMKGDWSKVNAAHLGATGAFMLVREVRHSRPHACP